MAGDTNLTLAAFIALMGLMVTIIGVVVAVMSRIGGLTERVARLEERLKNWIGGRDDDGNR